MAKGILDGASNLVSLTGGEAFTTLEYGKSFINKYAIWIFALIFTALFVKAIPRR